jgi:hypothetical protein
MGSGTLVAIGLAIIGSYLLIYVLSRRIKALSRQFDLEWRQPGSVQPSKARQPGRPIPVAELLDRQARQHTTATPQIPNTPASDPPRNLRISPRVSPPIHGHPRPRQPARTDERRSWFQPVTPPWHG